MSHIELPKGADPYFGWTEDKTKSYIDDRPLAVGDQMLIVNQQGGLEEYVLANVVNPSSGRQRRVILDASAAWGGSSFYRSGKNCFSPTGKSRMIPPVKEVVDKIKETPTGRRIMSNRLYSNPF